MKPGKYVPDTTEGVTRVQDLPQALVVCRSRDYRRRPCPRCGRSCYRDSRGCRSLHDLGSLLRDRPRELSVTYSKHRCEHCRLYFSARAYASCLLQNTVAAEDFFEKTGVEGRGEA